MYSQDDSLFNDIGVPDWYDDETLYSLCSRFHRLTGNPTPAVTALQLFGNVHSGYQHDLPSGIDYFTSITKGSRGSSREIIRGHTILPFYLPFRSAHDANDAYATMCGSSIGSLKYRLGILTSRFRANHPLKACTKCIQEDYDTHGVAYWHLSHQYPGVWVCLKHRTLLNTCTVKSTGVGRFMWFLPDKDILKKADNKLSIDSVLENYIALAKTSIAVSSLPDKFHFSNQLMLFLYKIKLKKHGFVTDHNCLRLDSLAENYFHYIKPLLLLTELSALSKSIEDTKSQIGRLLRTPRSGTHPLRHIILINWLFYNWDKFYRAYLTEASSHEKCDLIETSEIETSFTQTNQNMEKVLELIDQGGYSPTRAAKEIGIDTTTAVTWASQAGIQITRRPKVVSEQIRSQIVKLLKAGQDKDKIANKFSLSAATVSRILRSEIGLQQIWLDARFERRLKLERNRWLKLKKSHDNSGIKIMRNIAPVTYAWLYRNDQIWLKEINISIPKVQLSNNSNVDWKQRDNDFSKKIQNIVLDFSIHNPVSKITLADICVKLPNLKAKLERLDKLPLTYKALQIALGSRFHRKTSKTLI